MSMLTSLLSGIKRTIPASRKSVKKGILGECIKKVNGFLPLYLAKMPLNFLFSSLGAPHTGYHGTSKGALGKRQIDAMKFDPSNKRLYFADPETAKSYALKASERDGTEPIILYVGSHDEYETNHPDDDFHKGYYDFFPNAENVHIYAIHRLKH
jgi:hypothetical protein